MITVSRSEKIRAHECGCNFTWDASENDREGRRNCPEVPPDLVGRLPINAYTTARDVYNANALRLVGPGGFYMPDCVPRERVAVIIPYRDRLKHLQILLYHLHNFLQKQQLQYAIFVVEMAYPTQFNRGMLSNIGFLTAREMLNFTCYIIHDVDQLPADDRNLYRCTNNPRHLSTASSKYGYKLPYGHYIGGTIAFTPSQYLNINGFSNAYFGWGKEDDDLFKRIRQNGYPIDRPPPNIGVYEDLHHQSDVSNPDNPMKDYLFMYAHKRFNRDGVNKVIYTRLALEFRPLYTWIYVNTSELTVMKLMYSIDPKIKTAEARIKKLEA